MTELRIITCKTCLILLFLICIPVVKAGELHLKDGSLLMGEIVSMKDGTYVIETGFAGTLEIPSEQVSGVNVKEEVRVTLSSGDSLNGTLRYSPDDGRQMVTTALGDIDLSRELSVVAITDPDETSEKAQSAEVERLQKKVAAMEKQQASFADPWSGDVALGLNGARGNTDRLGISGRAEARRDVNGDRLMLYTEGNLQREDGVTTTNEILAGATLERDFSRKWFAFGGVDFEKDEFEDLELRAVANAGLGYFLARREDLTWKALMGLGYQHESFENGGSEEEGLVSFGYDLNYHYNEWLELLHKLTYYPSMASPVDDYRLVSNFGAQMPIGNTRNWKLRLNLRNQYDSSPRPGIEKLDTIYSLNLVYDFE